MPETSPLTRRELRERAQAAEARRTLPSEAAHSSSPSAGLDDLFEPEPVAGKPTKSKGHKRRWLVWLIILAFVLGLGGTAYALVRSSIDSQADAVSSIGDKVSQLLGMDGPHDYEEGEATGDATITIEDGDIGSTVSTKLFDAGVTLESDSFYNYLVDSGQNPTFYAGVYTLQQKMTSAAALEALEDPANKLENTVAIIEGTSAEKALTNIADVTGIPLEDLQAAADDYTSYGVPADAPSIEGFLFPATYTFEPDATAEDVIKTLVDEMFSRLDDLGVAKDDRLEVLTMAALVQREAGNVEDMPKVARVFQNRLDQGMLLQSDATVAYGTGNTDTVWTTDAERADESNPYNTYVHEGLPIGPIGLPGEDAIKAAISPADGDWLYFVPVNLATGETVFSTTLAEHEAALAQLQAWCKESDENAAYCE
ncbi:MAG: endolytic transglycosylase MltG [Microbacterium sp.]